MLWMRLATYCSLPRRALFRQAVGMVLWKSSALSWSWTSNFSWVNTGWSAVTRCWIDFHLATLLWVYNIGFKCSLRKRAIRAPWTIGIYRKRNFRGLDCCTIRVLELGLYSCDSTKPPAFRPVLHLVITYGRNGGREHSLSLPTLSDNSKSMESWKTIPLRYVNGHKWKKQNETKVFHVARIYLSEIINSLAVGHRSTTLSGLFSVRVLWSRKTYEWNYRHIMRELSSHLPCSYTLLGDLWTYNGDNWLDNTRP